MPDHISLFVVLLLFFNGYAVGELVCPVTQTGYCPGELIRCRCSIRPNQTAAWNISNKVFNFSREELGNGDRIKIIVYTEMLVISELAIHMRDSDISIACGDGKATLRLAGIPTVQLSHEVCKNTVTVNIDLADLFSPLNETWFIVQLLPHNASNCSNQRCQQQTINHTTNQSTSQVQFSIDLSMWYTIRVTPMTCIGTGNTTEITINNASLALTDSNSTHTCVEFWNNDWCNGVLTYTDAITSDTVSQALKKQHGTVCLHTTGNCGVWTLNGQHAVRNYTALDQSLSIQSNSSDCLLQLSFNNACIKQEWASSVFFNSTLIPGSRITWSRTELYFDLKNLSSFLGRSVTVLLDLTPPKHHSHRITVHVNKIFCSSAGRLISGSSSLKALLLPMIAAALSFIFV